jgi:hypothetical protein
MDEEDKHTSAFVADAAATARRGDFELFRSTAPRFTGHGLFHVLSELLPTAAGGLKVGQPKVWDAFCRRWAATPTLRLLWYAPEDSVDCDANVDTIDDIPVGAARFLYVTDYADLSPRTWRHALSALVDPYRGHDNLVCDFSHRTTAQRAVGSVIKQYLVLHTVDPAVVTHRRGGVLYLLGATHECTVGQWPMTISQIPLTICVVVDRKVLTAAQWRVLQRRFAHKRHSVQRLLRLDTVPSYAVLERHMAPRKDDSGDPLTWDALLLGATDVKSLGVVAQCLEARSDRRACDSFLHCNTLRIDASALRSEDIPLVWAVARLVAWLLMIPTHPQHTRNVTFVDNTPAHRVLVEDTMRRSDATALLPTEPLRQLYQSLAHKHLGLTAPITVLYMYSNGAAA